MQCFNVLYLGYRTSVSFKALFTAIMFTHGGVGRMAGPESKAVAKHGTFEPQRHPQSYVIPAYEVVLM